MFGTLKEIAAALEGIRYNLLTLVKRDPASSQIGGQARIIERLEVLELSRATWEAELEGLLIKATNERKAARAAEERGRKRQESYETLESDGEGFDMEALQRYAQSLPLEDADRGEEEPVPALYEDLALDSPKQRITRAKFGG